MSPPCPDLPLSGSSGFGAGRRLRHACEVSSRAALAPLLACGCRFRVDRVERRAWSAIEWGGPPPSGSRGPAVPEVGAQQPLIGCAV